MIMQQSFLIDAIWTSLARDVSGVGAVAPGGMHVGTLGFKYLMYYSTTDLDPQSAFTSYQKCSKVLNNE